MIRRTGVSLACASFVAAALLGPMGTSASAVPVAAAFLDPAQPAAADVSADASGSTPLEAALAGVPGLLRASAQVPVSSDTDSAAVTATGDVAVDVPRDPAAPVEVTGESGLSLQVDLPQAPQTADASPVADGVVGFTGSAPETDTAVQVLPDGARVLTVMYGPSAPYRFAFPLQLAPGARLEPDGDAFTVVDAQGQTLGQVDPAWALDAQGREVPASYELSGSTLTLVVGHAGMTYPVVADPSISSGGSGDAGGGKQLSGQGSGGGGGKGLGCDRAIHAVRNTACQGGSVNSRTGEFVLATADVGRPGRGVSFSMGRVYNSGDTAAGVMGPGWTHSYDVRLGVAAVTGNVTLYGEDGRALSYTKQTDGSFTGPAVSRSKLKATSFGYTLTRQDRTRYDFNASGVLLRILDHNKGDRNQLEIVRTTGGQIDFIREPAMARTHDFTYTNGLLSSVATADGRTVEYRYTSGRLTKVIDVGLGETTFGYDANGRIKTVTDARLNVVVTNTYGTDGRVELQTDPYGHSTGFGWDPTTLTSTMTDAKGKVFTDVYLGNNLASRDTPMAPPTQSSTSPTAP